MAGDLRQRHGFFACIGLALLALSCTPLTLLSLVWHWRALVGRRRRRQLLGTALITGGRAQKALYVARALSRKGYRIILAEEKGWGDICATRFSNSISKCYSLPSNGGKAYVEALVKIAQKEEISLFLPCSGVATGEEEAEAAKKMRKGKDVITVIQDSDLLIELHEKDRFIALVHELGLDAPAGKLVKTPEEGLALLQQYEGTSKRFLFKAATVPDDVGRADMTTYPLQSRQATEERLKRGLYIPLSAETPYLAQEFIGGKESTEWCTHATVIDGKVTAFVCCPSNDMLMTYHNATQTAIGERALAWTQSFLKGLREHPRWRTSRITGHFSFDFIHQPESNRLVVIECNPRVHTAICLLQDDSRLGDALDGSAVLSRNVLPIEPEISTKPISWLGHDIVSGRFLQRARREKINDLDAIGQDGAWNAKDPLAYFAFYHLQWPALLLRQAFIRRKDFSRINVSTARIFEC